MTSLSETEILRCPNANDEQCRYPHCGCHKQQIREIRSSVKRKEERHNRRLGKKEERVYEYD